MVYRKVIEDEIEEIIFWKNQLDDTISKVALSIHSSVGKVVVVGVGKSAWVAQKWVASFNSTGTPSQFLHATEAAHGDLGLVQKEDIVLCLSNSGSSPEIKNILPYLRERAKKIFAITGNLNSFLAKNADAVIFSGVRKEACPNNLAPTTSTTVQMIIGDALMSELIHLRGFTQEDFAKNHPGGAIGRDLVLTVGEVMNKNDRPFVFENSLFKEIVNSLAYAKSGITVVLNEKEEIMGVITDGDLRRTLFKYEDYSHLTAKDMMSTSPKTISSESLAKEALQIMHRYDIGQLVVLEDGRYVGIVDIHQLMQNDISA